MARRKKPPLVAFSDTEIHTWFERDRAAVELRDARTDKTIIEWWDEGVQDEVEAGFLNPRDWHGSAYETAVMRGFIRDPDAAVHARIGLQRRRNPELRQVVSDFAGVRRQWAMQKMPEGVRGYIVELERPRRGRYGRIKFEGKVWLGARELANARGATLRGVFQDLMHDMESGLRTDNPIRSKAQWRALAAKTRRGEISRRQWREMVRETKRGYRRLPDRVGRRAGKRRPSRARTRNSGYPYGHDISQKEWEHLDAIHELRMRRRMSAIVAAGDPDAVRLLEKGLVEIEYNTLYEDPHLRRKDLPGWALVLTPAGKLALESVEGSGLSAHYADIRKKRWRGRLGQRPRKANRQRKRR